MNQNMKYGMLLLGILAITLFISIYYSNFKNSIEGMGSPITGLTVENPPVYVKDLQPFITQFISINPTMNDETRANVVILQNLLTTSGPNADNELRWDDASRTAYTQVLGAFNAAPQPLATKSPEK